MEAILDFLKAFGNAIVSLVKFVISLIDGLLYAVGLLGSLIVKIPDMIGWLPASCIALVVTAFSIVVIYKILGREG